MEVLEGSKAKIVRHENRQLIMANNKTGFAYYNIDTDRYQDIRIKRLKKEFRCDGIAVYDYLLCEIYRVKGCFIEWDESTAFDVAEYFGLKETTVEEVVNYCCKVGLFDKELRASGSVLTSASIQRRYIDMCRRAKRNDVKIPEKINILPEECPIISEESEILPSRAHVENKVEKSREKKNRERIARDRTSLESDFLKRRNKFKAELTEHLETYGRDMLNSFFSYWTEPNKSGTMMKFEMEKTWGLSRRLARWAANEDRFEKKCGNEWMTFAEAAKHWSASDPQDNWFCDPQTKLWRRK